MQVRDWPFQDAVMVAWPFPTGVTSPSPETVATLVLELLHVIPLLTPETRSCTEPSATVRVKSVLFRLFEPLELEDPEPDGCWTFEEEESLPPFTRTMQTARLEPSVTRILVVPAETIVTLPELSTDATEGFSLIQV